MRTEHRLVRIEVVEFFQSQSLRPIYVIQYPGILVVQPLKDVHIIVAQTSHRFVPRVKQGIYGVHVRRELVYEFLKPVLVLHYVLHSAPGVLRVGVRRRLVEGKSCLKSDHRISDGPGGIGRGTYGIPDPELPYGGKLTCEQASVHLQLTSEPLHLAVEAIYAGSYNSLPTFQDSLTVSYLLRRAEYDVLIDDPQEIVRGTAVVIVRVQPL